MVRESFGPHKGEIKTWTATIEHIRRFGDNILEYKLVDVKSEEEESCTTDHLIWRLGRDVPRIPIIYSQLGRGNKIRFVGKIMEYKKCGKQVTDYNIKLIKILESKNGEQ
jgi:hypothetical protein